ncbi:hypothetical protein COMA1_20003 [Candidatus Nitrospira nitrosa]|uniref:Right handed beta helix domain-containing protein n=1 Tax=Candidatus Nitrospira nitrosa TaxID=1742972 RepID=A0A0S4LDC5_9BACT|nr:right-handed parallel beta-helix repeat-containing protein [Candidatus Nitrospira nitrosa]CUS34878.1 hypothetical protein COMA1_20003 [Candidatus Nitrospira nitrosa]
MENSWRIVSSTRLIQLYGLWLIAALLGTTEVQGATYYVATTGNDSNPGTLAQPFGTFKQAINKLQPGDTLYIRGGTYTEQMNFQDPPKTGIANAWLTIAGYPGEAVTLLRTDPVDNSYGPIKARGNLAYFVFENLILDGTNSSNGTAWNLRDGNHHFILRNLEIKNFKSSGLHIKGSDIHVLNCKIHDNQPPPGIKSRKYGIYFAYGDNVILDGNEIYRNNGGGIHAFPGPIRNAIIRGNRVYDNNSSSESTVPGILVFEDTDYYDGTAIIDGVHLYNNIVYGNGAGGIFVSNGAANVKVWNNTVYGNKGWGVNIQIGLNGMPVNTIVQNNIVFANTSGEIINKGVGSVIDHNVIDDPKFVNATARDFRIQAFSPAMDAGVALDEVRVDIKNVPRPQGVTHDIGAYEGGGSDLKSPNAPRSVSIN